MTADECKRQALVISGVDPAHREAASSIADKWLDPYYKRDATVDPGLVPVDTIDPETGKHGTVMQQIHPPRKVAPFRFGAMEATSLARHIRRELKI